MQRNIRGYTLTELLITTTIAAIILSQAIPALSDFTQRHKARQDITSLQMLLNASREQALSLGTRVTLCPLLNNQCSNNWNAELHLFTDPNNNARLDPNEMILHTLHEAADQNIQRHFNNKAISFDSRGFAGHATGSLSYCLKRDKPTGASIIISRNGRMRRGSDSNQDGIPETASGKNIPCPS